MLHSLAVTETNVTSQNRYILACVQMLYIYIYAMSS